MKCENKTCLNSVETGSKFCEAHGGKPPTVITGVSEPLVVSMSEVPKSGRFNEQAMKLVKKIRSLQSGSALRVEVKYYSLPTLNTVKRYATDENLRIGLRICGGLAYVWRLNEAEIKAVEEKGNRLRMARGKKKKAVA